MDNAPKIEIEPGSETSEAAATQLMQYGGGGLFTAVLALAATTDIPPSILITALICAALLGLAPTLHYIASRRALKCEQCRAQADVAKTIVAKQAAVAGRDTARSA